MWVHPTMDLGHPTAEVVYLIREILSVHGALERSKNPQHSRGSPCIACISLAITVQNYESVKVLYQLTSALDRSHSSPKRYAATNHLPTNRKGNSDTT